MEKDFILKGNICYSQTPTKLITIENGYLVCESGISKGVFNDFSSIPKAYTAFPVTDYANHLIIPGLCDLHIHAPQYANRGLGMDLELLDWLNTHTFPEESKYADTAYAEEAYGFFVKALQRSAITRAVVFATIHIPATILLMEKLEQSGLVTMVGKVNMDRNSPDTLREKNAAESVEATKAWIERTLGRFKNTAPIITPRFIPTCSDESMRGLKALQSKYRLPVQSHLSENLSEIAWVKELCPHAGSYGDAYDKFGLFGGENVRTIMAHCTWSKDEEEDLMKERGVYVAHCPQSNMNLASGIAPVRRFLKKSIRVGLGSDVAGGCHHSIFRAMSDAIQVSKLYWRLVDGNDVPLTVPEAFYMGTVGGGAFFGKVGSFNEGYEFDALVLNDSNINEFKNLSIEDRLARVIYFSNDNNIVDKYIRGMKLEKHS